MNSLWRDNLVSGFMPEAVVAGMKTGSLFMLTVPNWKSGEQRPVHEALRKARGKGRPLTICGSSWNKLTSSAKRCAWWGISNLSMAADSGSHTTVPDLVKHSPNALKVGPVTCSNVKETQLEFCLADRDT